MLLIFLLKMHMSFQTILILIVVALPLLIIASIVGGIKTRKEQKMKEQEQAAKQRIESTWANEDGKQFFENLKIALRSNRSAAMSSHAELLNLNSITKEYINIKFQVHLPQFQHRIWMALEWLHERHLAETSTLNGISEDEAQQVYSINLQNDELLYAHYPSCSWFELKRNQQRSFNYQGLGLRIPLGAGLSYRIGTIQNINPESRLEYKEIGTGDIFLTNKRVIFQSGTENKVIALKQILDIEQYTDSVIMGKATGKKPLIKFDLDDAALFSRKLSRLFETV